MNYPKKPGFNLYQSRHCAYITYSVKTWFLKILSLYYRIKKELFKNPGEEETDRKWYNRCVGLGILLTIVKVSQVICI